MKSSINAMEETVGITSIGYYIPPEVVSSEHIANVANLPLSVLTKKIGMKQKHIADKNEHPSEMGFKAAVAAINKANISPEEIDIIAYCGAGHYDYDFWSPSAKIQALLNAHNAYSFEIKNFCNSGNLGIHICRNLLLADSELSYALVICSDTLSRLIDPLDNTTPSLLMFGDGAVATILKKAEKTNVILSYHAMTNGTLADEIKLSLGGTKFPITPQNCNDYTQYIKVEDNQKLDSILANFYLNNYIQVIQKSLDKSGYSVKDIDFLLTNQIKKSLLDKILDTLKLTAKNTIITLTEYGHMGAVDTLFCLAKALEEGRIKSNNIVVLASSAAGFSWAAIAIQYRDI